MLEPPLAADEAQRLASLRDLHLLDTAPEERFDQVTRLAALLFKAPIALVSLVDENRQWFKSCIGLDVAQTGRDVSFCGHAILQDQVFVIEDAATDERFADNPLVTGPPHIRFYAGRPLHAPDGMAIGTLCIIDTRPRQLSPDDLSRLDSLGQWIEMELLDREAGPSGAMASAVNRRRFWAMTNDLLCIAGTDGYFKDVSPSFTAVLGYSPDELKTRPFVDFVHPEDVAATMAELERLKDGLDTLHFKVRFRHKRGRFVWLDWSATREGSAMFAAARDVTKEVLTEGRMERVLERLQEKTAQMRDFTRIVSHDLRAPLRHLLTEEHGMPDAATKAIKEMDTMIERLIQYERVLLQDSPDETCDLDEAWDDAASRFTDGIEEGDIQAMRPLGQVAGSMDHWTAVFRNLIDNSSKYGRIDGRVNIQLMAITEPDKVTLHYRDQGPGIPADVAQHLWEPFADPDRPSGRLGLAMVRRLVKRSGASIRLNPSSKGAHFIIEATTSADPLASLEAAS